jgi:hypothetical protein
MFVVDQRPVVSPMRKRTLEEIQTNHRSVDARALSKRVKVRHATDSGKENSQSFLQRRSLKLVSRPSIQNRRTVRPAPIHLPQPKINNISNLLIKHPISKHVLKSNLYSGENWIEQQQKVFTSVLNEVLESHDLTSKAWKDDIETIRATAFDYYQGETFQNTARRLSTVRLLQTSY